MRRLMRLFNRAQLEQNEILRGILKAVQQLCRQILDKNTRYSQNKICFEKRMFRVF